MFPARAIRVPLIYFAAALGAFLLTASPAVASTITVGSTDGPFSVGSTFEASLLLDTEGQSVNALDITINFPEDKLQVVSPSLGKSLISVWTAPPSYDNAQGIIRLQGGIPGGINVSRGLITTLTFRVRAPGSAVVRVGDSKVLLSDGQGTDSLTETHNGVYQLKLPPPAGPTVSSETHPNQDLWHNSSDVRLSWALNRSADAYSYVLDATPVTIPDNISEKAASEASYTGLNSGVHYFHIKALRGGVWGGTTHFAIRVDTEPPADFPISIEPSSRTSSRSPVVSFLTTDAHSGISHSEIEVIPLTPTERSGTEAAGAFEEPFFVEATSPYILGELPRGSYDIIVRVHDQAGNVRDVQERLRIIAPLFSFTGRDGLHVKEAFTIPWGVVFVLGVLLLGGLSYLAWRTRSWYVGLYQHGAKGAQKQVQEQLKELKTYRKKYGALSGFLLLVGVTFFFAPHALYAQSVAVPQVHTFPEFISNEEILYVGGSVQSGDTNVVLFIQDQESGEVLSVTITPSEEGEWFYRHHGFLSPGSYRVWAQGASGDQQSPPSPESSLTVESTAFQLGASRVSKETFYLLLFGLMSAVALALVIFTVWHFYHGRKRHRLVMQEVREAEESVRRGFAVLRRDIQQELHGLQHGKSAHVSASSIAKTEKELLEDLAAVESRIGQEVWDVEEAERGT